MFETKRRVLDRRFASANTRLNHNRDVAISRQERSEENHDGVHPYVRAQREALAR